MKKCSRCKQIKSLENFSLLKTAKDGYQYRCKQCQKEITQGKYTENRKEYYRKNIEHFINYRKLNKQEKKEYNKAWKLKNKESVKQYNKQYKAENKKQINEKHKNRIKTDSRFKLIRTIRCRTKAAIKGIITGKTTKDLLGASVEVVKKHLESQFKPGMSWENHGQWHIDHRIPFASANTKEDLIKLCHYTNLQPLWAHENLSKGAKLPVDIAP